MIISVIKKCEERSISKLIIITIVAVLDTCNNNYTLYKMAIALPTSPPFNVNDSAADIRWRKWTNLLIGLDVKDNKRQRSLLLHYAGEEVNEIFETLTDNGNDYASAKKKLDDYFAPKKNTEFEVYKFGQAKQQSGEGIDAYLTRLRQLSINCDFADADK